MKHVSRIAFGIITFGPLIVILAMYRFNAQAAALDYYEIRRLWILDGKAQVWRPDAGSMPTPVPDSNNRYRPALAFSWSADSRRLAAYYADSVRIWDLNTSQVIGQITHQALPSNLALRSQMDVAWSPDGNWIAVSTAGEVLIWDAKTLIRRTDCGAWPVQTNLAWRPDSRAVVGGTQTNSSAGGRISACSPDSPGTALLFQAYYPSFLAYSPDGTKLVVDSDSFDFTSYVRIYDAVTTNFQAALAGAYTVAWSPDGKHLALTNGSLIQIRDAVTYLPSVTIKALDSSVMLAWHPKANRLITNGDQGSLLVYDTLTGSQLAAIPDSGVERTSPNALYGMPGAIKWSPDGTRFAALDKNGAIRIYEEHGVDLTAIESATAGVSKATATPFVTLIPSTPVPILNSHPVIDPIRLHEIARSWTSESSNPYHWSQDGRVGIRVDPSPVMANIWELYSLSAPEDMLIRVENPNAWAFSPDGKHFAIVSSVEDARGHDDLGKTADAKILHIWPVDPVPNAAEIPNNDVVSTITWSPDGKWIAVGSRDHRLSLWDGALGQRIFSVVQPADTTSLFWSPDSRCVASVEDIRDVIVYCPDAGHGVQTWALPNATALMVAWSPNGAWLAVPSDAGLVRIWNAPTHQLVDTIQGHLAQVVDVVWSPDSRRLASFSADSALGIPSHVIVQDIGMHRVLADLSDLSPIGLQMGWNDRGTQLIVSEMDRWRVGILDVTTGTYHVLMEESGLLASSLSPDGRLLAYASRSDASLSILNVETRRKVASLPSKAGIYYLAWSPDGHHLVSMDLEGNVILWGA